MSEPTTPPEGTPESEPDKPGLVDTIRDEISKALGALFDSGKADVADGKGGDPAKAGDRSDVAAEVKREVAKLRDAEAAEAEKRSLAERVRELEDKLAKAAENPPEEFRRVTEWMWR
jgi:uncharacterized membrane protein (UPF0182 family)